MYMVPSSRPSRGALLQVTCGSLTGGGAHWAGSGIRALSSKPRSVGRTLGRLGHYFRPFWLALVGVMLLMIVTTSIVISVIVHY